MDWGFRMTIMFTTEQYNKILTNINFIKTHVPKSWNNTLRMLAEIEEILTGNPRKE